MQIICLPKSVLDIRIDNNGYSVICTFGYTSEAILCILTSSAIIDLINMYKKMVENVKLRDIIAKIDFL